MNDAKRVFISLCPVPFLWALSNSMIIPVLPEIQNQVQISKATAGLLITFLSVPTALVMPLAGLLSDRFGRLKVIIPGVFLYGLGGLIIGIAAPLVVHPYSVMVVGRIIQGIGASGMMLIAMSCTADIFQDSAERSRALGILEASNSTGKLAAPIIGGFVVGLSWYAPFFVYALASAAILLGLVVGGGWKHRNESKESQTLGAYIGQLMQAIGQKEGPMLAVYGVALLTVFSWFGALFFASQVLESRFGVTSQSRGLFLGIPVAILTTMSLVFSRMFQELPRHLFIIGGLSAMAVGGVGMALAASVPVLVGALSLIGGGMGTVLPQYNLLITSSVSGKQRGLITTGYGMLRALGSALSPPVFGLLMDWNRGLAPTSIALLAGAGVVVTALLIRQDKLMEAPEPAS